MLTIAPGSISGILTSIGGENGEINMGIKTRFQLIGLLVLTSITTALAIPGPTAGLGFGVETYRYKARYEPTSTEHILGLHLNYDYPVADDRFLRWHVYRTVAVTFASEANPDGKGLIIDLNENQQHEDIIGVDYQVTLPLSGLMSIAPHAGVEYRRFFHDSESTTEAFAQQKAYYALLPVGLGFFKELNDTWQLELSGKYQYIVYSHQIAYTAGTNLVLPTFNDIEANGHGLRFGIDMHYILSYARLIVGATIQSWHVRPSRDDPDQTITDTAHNFMPNNQEEQIGIHFLVHL